MHGVVNQDRLLAIQRWVSTVSVCSLYVRLLGRATTAHICMCRFFLMVYACMTTAHNIICMTVWTLHNGVCMHGLAVVEALWRPTGIYWN